MLILLKRLFLTVKHLNIRITSKGSNPQKTRHKLFPKGGVGVDPKFSIKEKQHLFQCRMDDLDVKANRNWKFENLICRSCDDPNKVETQQHILVCTALVNRNMKISYLPSYQDLYSDHVEDQMYTSMILGENIRLSLVPM